MADDLERCVEAASQSESVAAVLDGLRLVQQKFEKIMRHDGLERIDAVGERFDPTRHEALMQQASAEHEAGTVMQEVQTGYKYHDRVLRPTKVIIASTPPSADDGEPDDTQGAHS